MFKLWSFRQSKAEHLLIVLLTNRWTVNWVENLSWCIFWHVTYLEFRRKLFNWKQSVKQAWYAISSGNSQVPSIFWILLENIFPTKLNYSSKVRKIILVISWHFRNFMTYMTSTFRLHLKTFLLIPSFFLKPKLSWETKLINNIQAFLLLLHIKW